MSKDKIQIQRIICDPYRMNNNTYIVWKEGETDGIMIDASGDGSEILQALQKLPVKPTLLLLTHGHFDHISAINTLIKDNNNLTISIHAADVPLLHDSNLNYGSVVQHENIGVRQAPNLLADQDVIEHAGVTVKVMHTPGHSKGSCCFIVEDDIFSGDTVFYQSAGRTDLHGGNTQELVESFRKLFALPGDYRIHPGHDQGTTMEEERKHNSFIQYYIPELMKR